MCTLITTSKSMRHSTLFPWQTSSKRKATKCRPLYSTLLLLNRVCDRLVKDLQSNIHIFFRKNERRRPSDRVVPTPKYDQSSFEAFHFHLVPQIWGRFQGCFICPKFDTAHHSESANVADTVILVLKLLKSFLKIFTDLSGVVDQTSLEQFNCFHRC